MGTEARIDALIFSKDRACQLDLLLRSIAHYAPTLYCSVDVLWTASTRAYGDGYRRCFSEHLEADFALEHDFEAQVRQWLDRAGLLLSFLVDDDVFYRPAPFPREIPWAYRGGDYDYPLSLDGNVYERPLLCTVLAGISGWKDPTQLEATMDALRERVPFSEVGHGEPCLAGLPWNRVSSSSRMPHESVDPQSLNERYLAGARLDLGEIAAQLNWSEPAAHMQAEPMFG